jgi:alcohol dehydrogenase class IV
MIHPGTQHWHALQRVTYGRPAAEVVAEEAQAAGARRVLVATTRSLTESALVAGVIAALGSPSLANSMRSGRTPARMCRRSAAYARERRPI